MQRLAKLNPVKFFVTDPALVLTKKIFAAIYIISVQQNPAIPCGRKIIAVFDQTSLVSIKQTPETMFIEFSRSCFDFNAFISADNSVQQNIAEQIAKVLLDKKLCYLETKHYSTSCGLRLLFNSTSLLKYLPDILSDAHKEFNHMKNSQSAKEFISSIFPSLPVNSTFLHLLPRDVINLLQQFLDVRCKNPVSDNIITVDLVIKTIYESLTGKSVHHITAILFKLQKDPNGMFGNPRKMLAQAFLEFIEDIKTYKVDRLILAMQLVNVILQNKIFRPRLEKGILIFPDVFADKNQVQALIGSVLNLESSRTTLINDVPTHSGAPFKLV